MKRAHLLVLVFVLGTLVLTACEKEVEVTRVVTEKETVVQQETVVETVVQKETVVETVRETVVEKETVTETIVETVIETVVQLPPEADMVTLDMVINSEPPNLDPAVGGGGAYQHWLVSQMFMNLTGFDQKSEVIPELATDWSVSEDGLTWTFHLRDDVRWVHLDPTTGQFEDRGPVTAADTIYGLLRLLDPNVAAVGADVFYGIEGAEEFNMADPAAEDFGALRDAVGVKAVDDHTIEFKLNYPAGYFPALAAAIAPVPQATIEEYGDKWTEAGLILTNGPYALEEWIHGTFMRMVKNPLWFGADDVQIEAVQGPIIEEASTAMAMYEADEIDFMGDPGHSVPLPDIDRVKADPALSQEFVNFARTCTYYYTFINRKAPFDNVLVRKAFSAAIDRQLLIDYVTKGAERPAHSFAAPGIFGNVADDQTIGRWMLMDDYDAQVEQARAWLAEAGYPEGEGLGDVILLHNVSEAHAAIAQAIQAMWKEAFPKVNVVIQTQEWKVYLATVQPDAPLEDKPHIIRSGWCGSYPDQNNWIAHLWHTDGDNWGEYSNPAFDALVEQAAREPDPEVRKELYKQAEAILIDEDSAVAPIYHNSYVRLHKPWLTKAVIVAADADPIAQWRLDWEAKKAARE
jgi:oligopeptide transport system substrate-binding protein